jgi:hypothetical protein
MPVWNLCLFRGNYNYINYRSDDAYDEAQLMSDLKDAGNIFRNWAIWRNCQDQFKELVEALVSAQ